MSHDKRKAITYATKLYTSDKIPINLKDSNQAKLLGNSEQHLYAKLIEQSRNASNNTKGVLYLATEALPLNEMNANFKVVMEDKNINRLVESVVKPYPTPMYYNHDSGGRGLFGDGNMYPSVIGRNFASIKERNSRGGFSIYTGSMINDKVTIERIMDHRDINVSSSIIPLAYKCDVCGQDPMDENSTCDHYPGDVVNDEKYRDTWKNRFVTWSIFPDRYYELSITPHPAYDNATIKAYESYSTNNINTSCNGLVEYCGNSIWQIDEVIKKSDNIESYDSNSNKRSIDDMTILEEFKKEMIDLKESFKTELNEVKTQISNISFEKDNSSDSLSNSELNAQGSINTVSKDEFAALQKVVDELKASVEKLPDSFSTKISSITETLDKVTGTTEMFSIKVSELIEKYTNSINNDNIQEYNKQPSDPPDILNIVQEPVKRKVVRFFNN